MARISRTEAAWNQREGDQAGCVSNTGRRPGGEGRIDLKERTGVEGEKRRWE